MNARVLTLRYDPVLDAFDDGPLRELLNGTRLLKIKDHFFVHDGEPRLALIVHYQASEALIAGEPVLPRRERGERWQTLVSADDMPLFNTMREWRSQRAKKDGVPPYVICTNRQLALVIRARPRSLAKIGEVEGFGRGKLERYGQEMLALLARAPAGAGGPPEERPPSPTKENADE